MQSKKVQKAVFIVAGLGTRFLPYTKAQPKEMLPIVDKPIIQYLVEEAVEAGITEIIFVTAKGKESIENHFDKSFDLEHSLTKKGKLKLLEEVKKIERLASVSYVRQLDQIGDGHALLCARPWISDDEPVLMVFPDYIMPKQNQTFVKMIDAYNKTGKTVIATDYVPESQVSKYGVVDFEDTGDNNVINLKGFVEKPKTIAEAPSNLINIGYAVIPPSFWESMNGANSTVGDGEIRVADTYTYLLEQGESILAIKPEFQGYDCGQPIGFIKATIEFALSREEFRDELTEYLKAKAKEL
jgi:UTP--glucose-1-phosphate uridylyltransferase